MKLGRFIDSPVFKPEREFWVCKECMQPLSTYDVKQGFCFYCGHIIEYPENYESSMNYDIQEIEKEICIEYQMLSEEEFQKYLVQFDKI